MMVPAPSSSVTTPRRPTVGRCCEMLETAFGTVGCCLDADHIGQHQDKSGCHWHVRLGRNIGDLSRDEARGRLLLAQSILGHGDDLSERESRTLAALRGELAL